MRRDDLPLMLASAPVAGDGETQPLDRIRMQKAVFIAEQRGPDGWTGLYKFQPYNWGPFSRQLSSDLDRLQEKELLTTELGRFGRYPAFVTTALGELRAAEAWLQLPATHKGFLKDVRAFVATRSFNDLLRDVYAAFPMFAINSQFSG